MSWQAASMLLLAGALVGGALWYERSRPRPQVIALVAAMAALAAAGRVVFSPIPNVVPTTDLAVFSGYALGGAPGFMVGALSALISNLWLGQGPWTPWQMAGWGIAGLFGATLAVLTGRRLGRLGFALACAAMGLVYGALLDYSAMVVFGGEQSLERYLALSLRGIPFNLAHAAGNFAIALVAGPAIVDLLERHRRRFTHKWQEARSASARGTAVLLLALICTASAMFAGTERADAESAAASSSQSSALRWLIRAQNADGGFGLAPGRASDPSTSGWAALGLAAAGRNPGSVRGSSGTSVIGYLRRNANRIRTTGDIERTILALTASGLDARRFGGVPLGRRMKSRVGRDGSLASQVNLTAFYLMACVASGLPYSRSSIAWIKRSQSESGGWGYAPGVSPDADSTGAAIQALRAVDSGRDAIGSAVRWLNRNQTRQGGWGLPGSLANSQSTAWATQGLIAADVRPGKVKRSGRSPLEFLSSVQADDGHFRYSRSSDQTPVWVTAQALVAVAGRAFPVPAVRMRRDETGSSSEAAAGSGGSGPGAVGPGAQGGASNSAGSDSVAGQTFVPGSSGIGSAGEGNSIAGESSGSSWISEWWWTLLLAAMALPLFLWLGLRIRATVRS